MRTRTLRNLFYHFNNRKNSTLIVRLISTAQTGFFYTTQRPRLGPKLAAVKYDPQGPCVCHITSLPIPSSRLVLSISSIRPPIPPSLPPLFPSYPHRFLRGVEGSEGKEGGGRATVSFIVTIISANSDGWKHVLNSLHFILFFSETEGAVRRGQKNEKVENGFFDPLNIFWFHGGEVGIVRTTRLVSSKLTTGWNIALRWGLAFVPSAGVA